MLLRVRAPHRHGHDLGACIAHGRLDELQGILSRAEDEPRVEFPPAELQTIFTVLFHSHSFLSPASTPVVRFSSRRP